MEQQKTNYTELTKEILDLKKDNITFLFDSFTYKPIEEERERIFYVSIDSLMKYSIPILVLDDIYHFSIRRKKKKTVYTNELLYDEIIFINHDLELFISGDIIKPLLLDYLDKKYKYDLILEEKRKNKEKNEEYKKILLSLK